MMTFSFAIAPGCQHILFVILGTSSLPFGRFVGSSASASRRHSSDTLLKAFPVAGTQLEAAGHHRSGASNPA